MARRDNPCHKDCPKRNAECRLNCPAWDAYCEKRDAEYVSAERRAESDYIGHVVDRMERCRKRIHRRRKK